MNYCKSPITEVSVEGIQAWREWDYILEVLNHKVQEHLKRNAGKCVLAVETYPGVYDRELMEALKKLEPALLIPMEDTLCSREEFQKQIHPFLTDDRVFGRMCFGTLSDFQVA